MGAELGIPHRYRHEVCSEMQVAYEANPFRAGFNVLSGAAVFGGLSLATCLRAWLFFCLLAHFHQVGITFRFLCQDCPHIFAGGAFRRKLLTCSDSGAAWLNQSQAEYMADMVLSPFESDWIAG